MQARVILAIDTNIRTGRDFIRGVMNFSSIKGNWDFLFIGPYMKHSKSIHSWKPSGLLCFGGIDISSILPLNLPCVINSYFNQYPDLPSIRYDNTQIARIAADHLRSLGLRRFAFCGLDMFWAKERQDAFIEYLRRANYPDIYVHFRTFKRYQISWEKEEQITINWLQSLPKPIGIMACDDHYARYIARLSKMASIPIPEEIALIGVDNDDLSCECSNPPLSSVQCSWEKAGFEAAVLLEKLMKHQTVSDTTITVLPTYVIARQSTEIHAIEDTEIAHALNFIRTNAHKRIQVPDVVEATSLSKRLLYKRFKDVIGRTIHSEINRVRMEKIASLLLETDMSVLQIALCLGDQNDKHIARAFKKHFGLSPVEYRAKYIKPNPPNNS